MSDLGTILSRPVGLPPVTSFIKVGSTVKPGLVYIHATNGILNAPTDGSKKATELFWFEGPAVTPTVQKKVDVYELDGLEVIGKSDDIIPVDGPVKASTTTSHDGEFITHPIPTVADEGDTSTTDLGGELAAADQATYTYFSDVVGIYRGHEAEVKEGKNRTASADGEEDCVFKLRSGN